MLKPIFRTIPRPDDPEKSLLKTLWEKKKMLVTSIFFFSQNVFYPITDKVRHSKPLLKSSRDRKSFNFDIKY